jgi:hypothetical protein
MQVEGHLIISTYRAFAERRSRLSIAVGLYGGNAPYSDEKMSFASRLIKQLFKIPAFVLRSGNLGPSFGKDSVLVHVDLIAMCELFVLRLLT